MLGIAALGLQLANVALLFDAHELQKIDLELRKLSAEHG